MNPNHYPAGSSRGGQFAPKGASGGSRALDPRRGELGKRAPFVDSWRRPTQPPAFYSRVAEELSGPARLMLSRFTREMAPGSYRGVRKVAAYLGKHGQTFSGTFYNAAGRGTVRLSARILERLHDARKKGKVENFEHVDAIDCLTHEVLHGAGHKSGVAAYDWVSAGGRAHSGMEEATVVIMAHALTPWVGVHVLGLQFTPRGQRAAEDPIFNGKLMVVRPVAYLGQVAAFGWMVAEAHGYRFASSLEARQRAVEVANLMRRTPADQRYRVLAEMAARNQPGVRSVAEWERAFRDRMGKEQ